jgi:hypothetical protein
VTMFFSHLSGALLGGTMEQVARSDHISACIPGKIREYPIDTGQKPHRQRKMVMCLKSGGSCELEPYVCLAAPFGCSVFFLLRAC